LFAAVLIMESHEHSLSSPLSNAEIADRLARLAQLLSVQKENPYKVRAYQRAAARIRQLPESLDEMVSNEEDLTQFSGIGDAMASAIREIVRTGTLGKLEKMKASAPEAHAGISQYPRLDPRRVLRVYKKLGIDTIEELRNRLDAGEIKKIFGARMAYHLKQGLTESHAMLLYHADLLREAIENFLLTRCGVVQAETAGDYRRRVEVIDELFFVVQTQNFANVIARMQSYGGRTPLVSSSADKATFALSSGILLQLQLAARNDWGYHMVVSTGSKAHLKELLSVCGPLRSLKSGHYESEVALYRAHGLHYIEPELREGRDEVERASTGTLPRLVTVDDIRGDLHTHSTSSDGADTIEDMAEAARAHGYHYIGISDHSQSLKIARGVSIDSLKAQLRYIDKLNGRLRGIRVLKSSEVDILADGSLDYPNDLLKELDYTVCSIHSRFNLDREAQTERLLRAMDNRCFNILGHATGRLLLKRPGYDIDVDRVIEHARANGCFLEINSSPDRLDVAADTARKAAEVGIMISISTDSHSTGELELIRCGLDQARRAGLEPAQVLNCLPWTKLQRLFRR
jgi:DNA polymerase (family 10)